jgi:hypothetical protein
MTCACGKPLHYSNPELQAVVDALIANLGPEIVVTTPDGSWKVPRHYIALHGLKAYELSAVAERLGFGKMVG